MPARDRATLLGESGFEQDDWLAGGVRAFRQIERRGRIAELFDKGHDQAGGGIFNRIGDQIFNIGNGFVAGRSEEGKAVTARDGLQ